MRGHSNCSDFYYLWPMSCLKQIKFCSSLIVYNIYALYSIVWSIPRASFHSTALSVTKKTWWRIVYILLWEKKTPFFIKTKFFNQNKCAESARSLVLFRIPICLYVKFRRLSYSKTRLKLILWFRLQCIIYSIKRCV